MGRLWAKAGYGEPWIRHDQHSCRGNQSRPERWPRGGKTAKYKFTKAAAESLEQARHKFSRRRCYYDSLAGVAAAGIRALRYRKGTIFDAVILACSGRIRLGCPSASGSPVAQALVQIWQHTTIDIGYLRYTAIIVNMSCAENGRNSILAACLCKCPDLLAWQPALFPARENRFSRKLAERYG